MPPRRQGSCQQSVAERRQAETRSVGRNERRNETETALAFAHPEIVAQNQTADPEHQQRGLQRAVNGRENSTGTTKHSIRDCIDIHNYQFEVSRVVLNCPATFQHSRVCFRSNYHYMDFEYRNTLC